VLHFYSDLGFGFTVNNCKDLIQKLKREKKIPIQRYKRRLFMSDLNIDKIKESQITAGAAEIKASEKTDIKDEALLTSEAIEISKSELDVLTKKVSEDGFDVTYESASVAKKADDEPTSPMQRRIPDTRRIAEDYSSLAAGLSKVETSRRRKTETDGAQEAGSTRRRPEFSRNSGDINAEKSEQRMQKTERTRSRKTENQHRFENLQKHAGKKSLDALNTSRREAKLIKQKKAEKQAKAFNKQTAKTSNNTKVKLIKKEGKWQAVKPDTPEFKTHDDYMDNVKKEYRKEYPEPEFSAEDARENSESVQHSKWLSEYKEFLKKEENTYQKNNEDYCEQYTAYKKACLKANAMNT